MAEKALFQCDRCDVENQEKKGSELPVGWGCILGICKGILCPECVSDLTHFMRGARIEHIAVERDKTVPA